MKKRLLALLLAVSMVFSATACEKGNTDSENNSNSAVTTTLVANTTTTNNTTTTVPDTTTGTDTTVVADTTAANTTTATITTTVKNTTTAKGTTTSVKATKPKTRPETKPETKPKTKPETKPETKPVTKPVTKPITTAEPPVVNPTYYGFKVSGTKLLDANGNEFVLRGINHAHTWFKGQKTTALKGIANTGSNSVRIVLSNSYQWSKDDVNSVKSIIEECKKNKMIAVLEVHDGTGSNSISVLENIAKYWIEIKDALIGNEEYVILNIANEWVGDWSGTTWRNGYVSVIPKLRKAGIKNTIMVDAAGWGQYGKSVADYGKEVFNSDPDKNTMFSIHMYGSAGGNQYQIRSNIENVTNKGLAVCIGEFGYYHSDGDVDEEYIMKYCTENKIGYMGWSWKGNGGGVEYLDISNDWAGQNLSSAWGMNLVNGAYGIKKTSKICSVFK